MLSFNHLLLLILTLSLAGCDSEEKMTERYKSYTCSEAQRGAQLKCDSIRKSKHNYLGNDNSRGIDEKVCADIASQAFLFCYESMSEKEYIEFRSKLDSLR